jgi:hypothetical protein
MENLLKFAQDKFTHGFLRDIGDELDFLESLLAEAGQERLPLVTWVFKDYKMGFIGTRRTAGLILYAESPNEFWEITNDLMKSKDPDDRDSAFEAICEVNDSRKYELIRSFLFDDYLWLDAVDFFIENDMNRAEIEEILFQFVASDDPKTAPIALNRLGVINARKNKNWKVENSYVPMIEFYSPKGGFSIKVEARFLEMLLNAIRLIASDFEQQLNSLPMFTFAPNEIASTFDEAFQYFDQVIGAKLVSEAQINAVTAIHHYLDTMRQNKKDNNAWTVEAIKTSPVWQEFRLLGKSALLLFNQPDDPMPGQAQSRL